MIVFDSSAIIAVLAGESGDELVRQSIQDGAISSVNFSEVVGFFARGGHSRPAVRELIDPLKLTVVPFDTEHATAAGMLIAKTRAVGLSLGDRACLALARSLKARILTADRVWLGLREKLDLDIVLIR